MAELKGKVPTKCREIVVSRPMEIELVLRQSEAALDAFWRTNDRMHINATGSTRPQDRLATRAFRDPKT